MIHTNHNSFISPLELAGLTFILIDMQVMDMLGPSLWDVWNSSGQT